MKCRSIKQAKAYPYLTIHNSHVPKTFFKFVPNFFCFVSKWQCVYTEYIDLYKYSRFAARGKEMRGEEEGRVEREDERKGEKR